MKYYKLTYSVNSDVLTILGYTDNVLQYDEILNDK